LSGAPLAGTVWAAGGSRPAVLLVSNTPPNSAVAPALARSGFAVVSWARPGPGTEDIGRVTDALGAGALSVRASSYALLAEGAASRDAIRWATTDRLLAALVTWGMTLAPGERAATLEEGRLVTCPWLLLVDERDKSAGIDAHALAESGEQRVVATSAGVADQNGVQGTAVRTTIAWLARHV
jgi:hypothetical protein